jgi:hypothetical protein
MLWDHDVEFNTTKTTTRHSKGGVLSFSTRHCNVRKGILKTAYLRARVMRRNVPLKEVSQEEPWAT